MAATELQQMIEVVAKGKGIGPAIVIGAIEDAYLAASKKVFKGDEDLRTRFNLETGQVELYAVRQIVPEGTAPPRRPRSGPPPGGGTKPSAKRSTRSSASASAKS